MNTYATRTRTGQRLTDVFEGPDGWCAHVEGADTDEGRNLAAQAITAESGTDTTSDQLEKVDADRFPRSTLYLRRPAEDVECIESAGYGPNACSGPVEYRYPLSGTGASFPRCETHWQRRLDREHELRERYPQQPPADWSPDDAGEAWGEEDY